MNITVSADTKTRTKAAYNHLINELGIETVTLALIDAMDTTISNIGSDGKFVSDGARAMDTTKSDTNSDRKFVSDGAETMTLKSSIDSDRKFVSSRARTTTLKSRLDSIKTIYGL